MEILWAVILLTAVSNVVSQFVDVNYGCKDNEVLCGDGLKCIPVYNVCDYTYDCEDHSDEELSICKKVQSLKSDCSAGNIKCTQSRTCMDLNAACKSQPTCIVNSPTFSELCKDVGSKKLKPNYDACSSRNKTLEILGFVASAFNGSTSNSIDSCPSLYVRVGSRCISFFTPAEIGWNEAKLFCESISGSLITLDNFAEYGELLTYMKNKGIRTKFWIGGQFGYKGAVEKWMWLDGRFIEMGAPYWSVYWSSNCTAGAPTNNCHSSYELMPRTNTVGYCVAINVDFFYYFSDENCISKKSPICLYRKT